jgi:hypothetical protein
MLVGERRRMWQTVWNRYQLALLAPQTFLVR